MKKNIRVKVLALVAAVSGLSALIAYGATYDTGPLYGGGSINNNWTGISVPNACQIVSQVEVATGTEYIDPDPTSTGDEYYVYSPSWGYAYVYNSSGPVLSVSAASAAQPFGSTTQNGSTSQPAGTYQVFHYGYNAPNGYAHIHTEINW